MILKHDVAAQARYAIEADYLTLAKSDRAGVPLAGRRRELAMLREVGHRDASLGRIFEGHLNAGQLVARFASPAQKTCAENAIDAGHLFGVWNTQDEDVLQIASERGRYVLHGAKTWASGAGSVTRPIVTAKNSDGGVQMCLLPMERIAVEIDRSHWHPLGMHGSDSFRISLEGVCLDAEDLIGGPGDYERQPWFYAGALRFAAVQTGMCERLFMETAGYLFERGRHEDPYQLARVADMRIAFETALRWIDAGREAWESFDSDESQVHATDVIEAVDMVRTAVERAAMEIVTLSLRSVGAHGLVEPFPFARLIRDLQMYLRQPAPDAALVRVGSSVFSRLAAARSAVTANSTGTGS